MSGSTTPGRATGAVLFTDLVGFTAYTEAAGDDAAVRVLDEQLALASTAIGDDADARIVKELGDGLLLWFGCPETGLRGALGLAAAVHAARSDGTFPLATRLGLHCGEVSMRGDDVVGLTVNIASRIAGLAAPGELLVSDAVVEACEEDIARAELQPVGPIRVKGLRAPIWLHRVTVATERPARAAVN